METKVTAELFDRTVQSNETTGRMGHTDMTVTIGSDASNDAATQRGSQFKFAVRQLCTLKVIARALLLCSISVIPLKSFAQTSCYYPVSWEAQGNIVNGSCLPTDSLRQCLQNGANWATNAYVGTPTWTLDPACAVTFPNQNIYECSADTVWLAAVQIGWILELFLRAAPKIIGFLQLCREGKLAPQTVLGTPSIPRSAMCIPPKRMSNL